MRALGFGKNVIFSFYKSIGTFYHAIYSVRDSMMSKVLYSTASSGW